MTQHRILEAHILDRLRAERGDPTVDRSSRRLENEAGDYFSSSRRKMFSNNTTNESWYRKEVLRLSRELTEAREENRTLRALKTTAHQKVAKRLAGVESRVKELLNANKSLEKKRALDAEGWRAELTLLRQRVDAAERRLRRLGILVHVPDGDHKDVLLRRESQPELGDETDESLSDLCHEFATVQLALDRLSERLPHDFH